MWTWIYNYYGFRGTRKINTFWGIPPNGANDSNTTNQERNSHPNVISAIYCLFHLFSMIKIYCLSKPQSWFFRENYPWANSNNYSWIAHEIIPAILEFPNLQFGYLPTPRHLYNQKNRWSTQKMFISIPTKYSTKIYLIQCLEKQPTNGLATCDLIIRAPVNGWHHTTFCSKMKPFPICF